MNIEKQKIIGVIPARFESSRFRGKILADICGKPMVQHVYERSLKSELLDDLYIATDDIKVKARVEAFGGKAIMTGVHHQTGTDRIAECIEKIPGDIIVNIQGDQPIIDCKMIDEAVLPMINNQSILMSTLKREIEEDEYNDINVVKVVVDENNFALYFSRSLIPYPMHSDGFKAYEHVGLYAYRRDFLLELTKMPMSNLEKIESLEQLRVLEKGYKIYVAETKADRTAGMSVDTPEDLLKIERILNNNSSSE